MHDHHHGHDHSVNIEHVTRAFVIGVVLNFVFVVIEVITGLSIHSLSLLSDAGHNLADVASLALSLFAIKMLRVKATQKYTYGYKKTTILIALFNAVLLLASITVIGFEAIQRLMHPVPLPGKTISIVAGIGIVINAFTALLFLKNKEDDLNVKSAYLHLMSDAAVSVALVIGGIIVFYTHYYWIDAVLSILVAIIILLSTWNLLRRSLRLSLDGVPDGIDMEYIREVINKLPGVVDFHHIHIWAMSTTENALTGHLVVAQDSTQDSIQKTKAVVKHELEHLKITHSTVEIEFGDARCVDPDC